MKFLHLSAEDFYQDLLEDLNVHKEATEYNLYGRSYLTKIPKEISQLQNLKTLKITSCNNLEELPIELVQMPNFELLIFEIERDVQLPKNIGLLTNLKELQLRRQLFYEKTTDWSPLLELKNLKKLGLYMSVRQFKVFPDTLCQMTWLESLKLQYNGLKGFPPEIGNLTALKELDISCEYCLDPFPKVLAALPNLERLITNAETLHTLPMELFQLKALKELKVESKEQQFKLANDFEKLWLWHQKQPFSEAELELIGKVLHNPQTIELTSVEPFLPLLQANVPILSARTIALIEKIIKQQPIAPIQQGAKVYISGKVLGKVTELKARLKTLEIDSLSKFTKDCTHLVLAAGAAISAQELQANPNLVIYTEMLLVEQLNLLENPFLLEKPNSKESAVQIDSIRQLLYSPEENNVWLGFEILKTGGFPKELITDLFIIYKVNSSPKIRKEILYYMNQYASAEFVLLLKNRLVLFGDTSQEDSVCDNLLFYCETKELDRLRLVNYVYEHSKLGMAFALLHLNTEDKRQFMSPYLKNGKLDLSKLRLQELPKDLAKLGLIKSLDLSNNYFEKLPIAILKKLPDLEELHITLMRFLKDFPKELLTIPTLKKVYVSRQLKNLPSKQEQENAGCEVIVS